jgi:hypothetical protein
MGSFGVGVICVGTLELAREGEFGRSGVGRAPEFCAIQCEQTAPSDGGKRVCLNSVFDSRRG